MVTVTVTLAVLYFEKISIISYWTITKPGLSQLLIHLSQSIESDTILGDPGKAVGSGSAFYANCPPLSLSFLSIFVY
jgi:hypothetical protein